MTRSVFVTGGAGLLGVNWATSIRDGFSVTVGLHDRNVRLRDVHCSHANLESVGELTRAFEEAGCFMVVHTAGITSVEACEADPTLARHVNVELAANVAQACARVGIALAHISTDHLFGDANGAHGEADPVSPTNVYGRTKAEAERRVLDVHPSALVVRTNFYGWGPSYRPSFSDVIIDRLRRREAIRLFHDVSYTPILMQELIAAVHALTDLRASGIMHVVGDDSLTKHSFGLQIAAQFGLDPALVVPISIADKHELVARPRRMSLSNQRATTLLGRPLGGIHDHLAALQECEKSSAVEEIRTL